MPGQPELDEMVKEMLEAQGEKEAVRAQIMQLSDANKWQLYSGYAATKANESGDVKDLPEHWVQLLNLEPTKSNLEELSVLLRQKPVSWVNEFIELRGVIALSDLLELLEKKAFKKPSDFDLMGMVLRCLRSLMNLENGMDAILGLLDDDDDPTPKSQRGGLRQLALCIDTKNDSTEARTVQQQPQHTATMTTATAPTPAPVQVAGMALHDYLAEDDGTITLAGIAITGGHLFAVMAMRNGEISFVAPFRYTGMIWAILFGFLLFGDLPDMTTIFGTVIVVGMGIYALHREQIHQVAATPKP